ncbi:DUF927 domain-containing protein [Devosia ginsengisoli]|uniref:DUF927 domain-containing protein n=1 Tax=Devosia ginsengisoli TaxID=400770 RepID=UPI0026E9C0AE|nr:DUF927 domain-containing protein [Devosia ginsengisoli]MCR6670049.1 DUF927 domain-containing protein [Devosia ginsengisoli]
MIAHDIQELTLEPPDANIASDAALAWARCPGADPSHAYLARYRLPRLLLRQIGHYLVAPISDLSETIVGLRLVDPSGASDAWPKREACAPVIFGSLHGPTEAIIVRGRLADAMAIHVASGICVLHVPPEADAQDLRRRVLATHPRMKVLIAEQSAAASGPMGSAGHRVEEIIVPPPYFGWAELHAIHGPDAVCSWIDDPMVVFHDVAMPRSLVVRHSGAWLTSPEELGPIRVSGPVVAVALAHDERQVGWRRLLWFRDRDGRERHLTVAEEHMLLSPRKVVARLVDAGLELARPDLASALMAELARTQVERRFIIVDRGGWHGGHYVGSRGTMGPDKGALPVQEGVFRPAMRMPPQALETWGQDIAAFAEGNSRLTIALGTALGGLAIGLLQGQASFGVHLRGPSSIGKSTGLRVAGSIYGPPRKEIRSWSSTEAGLEAVAARHHNRILILDELAQIAPEAAVQAGYLLGNGAGRERSGSTGRGLPTQTWQLTFLSSGEIGLEEKIAERASAPVMREGQAVRLIDLNADAGKGHGLFDTIHGHASGADLSDHLNRAAEASQGEVEQAFVAALAEDADRSRALLATYRERFIADHLPDDADGITRRVFSNLGLLAAACELASRFGVLPWPEGSGMAGVAACAWDWHKARVQHRPASPAEAARAWMEQNAGMLAPWEAGEAPGPVLGYIRSGPQAAYLLPEGWRALCGEIPALRMKDELIRMGMLRHAPARLPGAALRKFYIITLDPR